MAVLIVIGLAGHIGSGKDAVASHLCRAHGFQRIGMSDALKYEVSTKLRRTLEAYIREHGKPVSDMDAEIHRLLYVERTPVTRALLQEFGTDVRRCDDPDYWVKRTAERIRSLPVTARIAIPDCRFINEAQMVRSFGGLLLRVTRPGHDGDSHESEHGLDEWTDWDAVVINDGTLADLEAGINEWLKTVSA